MGLLGLHVLLLVPTHAAIRCLRRPTIPTALLPGALVSRGTDSGRGVGVWHAVVFWQLHVLRGKGWGWGVIGGESGGGGGPGDLTLHEGTSLGRGSSLVIVQLPLFRSNQRPGGGWSAATK